MPPPPPPPPPVPGQVPAMRINTIEVSGRSYSVGVYRSLRAILADFSGMTYEALTERNERKDKKENIMCVDWTNCSTSSVIFYL